MKKLFLGVLAIAGLVACVQEDVVNTPNLQEEIGFSGYVDGAVRSADPSTTTGSINHFTVWAYADNSQGLVLEDELVSKSGDVWTYSNVQYWLKKHNYRFFALTPYVANQTNNAVLAGLDNPYENYLGGLSFTNVDGTEDLLYATAEVSTQTSIPESVQFAFDHLLSKIKFTFVNGFTTDNIDLAVTNIKMVVPATASTTLGAQVHNGYVWDGHDGELTLDFGNAGNGERIDATKNVKSDNERLTFPAKVDAGLTYKVTFTVDQYIGTQTTSAATYNLETTITGVELEAGKAYNFIASISSETLDLQTIEFDVTVDEWDSEVVEENVDYFVDKTNGNYVVVSNDGLGAIAEGINEGTIANDITISLNGDIDLAASTRAASNWTPIGTSEKPFEGTFNGNDFAIKNFNYVTEASDFYVGFFGNANNATIKNVTFENVNVKVGGELNSNEGGHIAAVVGALEGTSTIENVTVKGNIYVEADVTANNASRVAVVVGGNGYGDVTVKNVHVIANDGSYVKANNCVGALAGQLNRKASFENCSSNINVTGTKFFAGGIIGLAPTIGTFVNCHSTGDVAITAGRAGNANDLHRVGGIAGGWGDNTSYPCVLTDCSYTGKISGQDADGKVATTLNCDGFVGRGYSALVGVKVIINGVEYISGNDKAYYHVGQIVEVAGAKAIVFGIEEGIKAVSVEELNLNGKNWQNAIDWAAGLGEGWALASIYELDAIHTARVALNKALVANNAENALFEEDDYQEDGKYAIYLSSTEAEGNDPQGEAYFSNRVLVKYFNLNGYWDYPYSTFASISKYAPLKSNYYARGVVAL